LLPSNDIGTDDFNRTITNCTIIIVMSYSQQCNKLIKQKCHNKDHTIFKIGYFWSTIFFYFSLPTLGFGTKEIKGQTQMHGCNDFFWVYVKSVQNNGDHGHSGTSVPFITLLFSKLKIYTLLFFFLLAGVRTPNLAYIMHCPYQLS